MKLAGLMVALAVCASCAEKPAPKVDAERAMQYTREIVAFGTRPLGSPGHKKVEEYLLTQLNKAGAQVEEDAFIAQTPAGPLPVRNILAKFPGTREGVIVVASHYDTNYGFPKDYVGANDGAATSGLLLELANQLRNPKGKARAGYSVWLFFTDGEEAIKQWTNEDSLYGTRHLAAKWLKDGTMKKVKAFLLLDMIGDADLNIERDHNSTDWLEELVGQAAKNLGYQSYFYGRDTAVDDDHKPFVKAGVPSADLIDFDYGYNNVFWHTPQDTLDKLSVKSLRVAGDTVLETIRLLEQR